MYKRARNKDAFLHITWNFLGYTPPLNQIEVTQELSECVQVASVRPQKTSVSRDESKAS